MNPFEQRHANQSATDYPHSYHIHLGGESMAVSVICDCSHAEQEHSDFLQHLVDLLNDQRVRDIAKSDYHLTIYNQGN